MAVTSIEWTVTVMRDGTTRPGFTFNPWRGCSKVSPGCEHCYAETLSRRNPSVLGVWGSQGKRVVAAESYWRLPLKWDRDAAAAGERRKVFCASLADVFEDRPELTKPRCRLLNLIHQTPHLDWLLLTKRPEGIRDRLHECSTQEDEDHGDDGRLGINDGACLASQWKHGSVMPNIWLGVSVEDQKRADERIPLLLRTPAAVRFVSAEPLLSLVDLTKWFRCEDCRIEGTYDRLPDVSPCFYQCGRGERCPLLHWVIVGGESGPGARPCAVDWIRSLVAQCRAAGVAAFVKQLGSDPRYRSGDYTSPNPRYGAPVECLYRLAGVADKKGGSIDEFPEDLRVREFPERSAS